ncbi:hypothetical protein CROQUDRAFT_16071, partial [Cronartium quercuum f. sp. fusiforme G11]
NIKILAGFVVMENVKSNYLILGDDFLSLYGFTIAQHQSPTIKIESDERFKEEINEAAIGPHLSADQKTTIEQLIKKYHNEFGLGKFTLGKINKHPVSINLTVNKPYPPILKKTPYPASPRNRIEIEKHIDELLKIKVIRKLGNNKAVDIATPVIIAWHNGKSRLCRDFRALNTYTVPDRCPLPWIPYDLRNLSKAKNIT